MSKELIIEAAKAKLVAGQDELLGQVIGDAGDQMVDEFKASLPPVDADEQAKIDAAVAAAKAEDQVVLSGVQQQLMDLQAKGQMEADHIAVLEDVVTKIKALLP